MASATPTALPAASQGPLREALKLCGWHLRFAILFSAIVNLAYLAPTLYMLQVYDRVVPSGSGPTLLFLTLALAATLFVLTYLDRMRSQILLAAGVRLNEVFASRIFRGALASAAGGQPIRLNQMVRDFDTIRAVMTGPPILALFDAPWIPIYIVVCFIVHPLIGALALGGAVLLGALAIVNERSTRGLNRQAATATAVSAVGQDSMSSAADVVRALGMSGAFLSQFEAARADVVEPQLEGARSTGRISALIRFLRLLLQSIALGAGAWLAIEKQISGGAIFASSMLAARALSPIDMIVANWRLLSAGVTSYASVRDQLRYEPPPARTQLPPPKARLTVRQVSVLAPARERPQPLIDGISFEATTGQVIGVVGASGSGKTTLLQVIADARIPDRGEARLDGARYAEWDPERLGRYIGYLPQDSALFPGSIKDNISRFERWTGADPELIDRKTLTAARAAEIHDLILTLPQGYETVLGPRGRGLSAGQQQRVALARALYGDPFLYVLDEPNANVDAEGEIALLRLITRLKGEGAIVVISVHRASLMGVVDVLAQLRGGRLERFGPRDQVLAALQAPAGLPAIRPAADRVL